MLLSNDKMLDNGALPQSQIKPSQLEQHQIKGNFFIINACMHEETHTQDRERQGELRQSKVQVTQNGSKCQNTHPYINRTKFIDSKIC